MVIDNLRHKIRSPDPLDRAIDFLSLAHDFVGKHGHPLATVCLQKAEALLNVSMTEMAVEYACGLQTVKEQSARTIDKLRRSAV